MNELYEQKNALFWRIVALTLFCVSIIDLVLWVFVVKPDFHSHDVITIKVFVVICSVSMLALFAAIFVSKTFPVCAALCSAWGLLLVADGYATFGLLFFVTGYRLASKFGLLHAHLTLKRVASLILIVTVMLLPLRYGYVVFARIGMEYCTFIIIAGVAYLFFLPDTQRIDHEANHLLLNLPSPQFTAEDVAVLQKILAGAKYESIAANLNISPSMLNRKIKQCYIYLNVGDQNTFICRYARYTITLDSVDGK